MRYERSIVALILLAFVGIAFAFSRGPLLEGPNEVEHYRFMRLLVAEGRLPDRDGYPYGQLHQAPLYYMIGAPVLLLADDPLFDDLSERLNPYHGYEFAEAGNDNKNIHLHQQSDEASNFAGILRMLRIYSIILGLLTILISYNSLCLLFPDSPHLRIIGLAVVAFTPQFVFMSSVVNNDNLLFVAVAASFNMALRQAIKGPTYRTAILLGVALGVALLAKSLAGMLVLPMAFAVLSDRRTWFWYAPVTLAVVLLVSGWWYVGNYLEYGEFTGMGAMFETWPSEIIRQDEIALDVGLERAPYGYQSFWARFGYGAVAMGSEVYRFFDVVTVLSVLGLLVWGGRHLVRLRQQPIQWEKWRTAILVIAFTLVWVVALIYSASTVLSGNQGRYLIPGYVGWGIFIAVGLNQWIPRRLKSSGALIFAGLMFIVLGYTYIAYFNPAYQVQQVTAGGLQPRYVYEDTVALLDVTPDHTAGRPGDLVEIDLTWQVLAPTDRELLTYIHTTTTDLIRRDTYPGTGNFMASEWDTGDTWLETHHIRIPSHAPTGQIYPLIAGYYDIESQEPLQVIDANTSQATTPFIGNLIVHGESGEIDAAYQFGDHITMTEPEMAVTDNGEELCFVWQTNQQLEADYTVFMHLRDDTGEIVYQEDFKPKLGQYPTWAWAVGEIVEYCHFIATENIPDTVTNVAIGMYDPTTIERLALTLMNGDRLEHDMLIIPHVTSSDP